MLIAQISDLHVAAEGSLVVGKVNSRAALADAVARLNALRPRPDLVVITGDLVNGPKPGEYEALAPLLKPLAIPWCAIPGNHDDRGGIAADISAPGSPGCRRTARSSSTPSIICRCGS